MQLDSHWVRILESEEEISIRNCLDILMLKPGGDDKCQRG